jgi:hypothetical protein
MLSYSNSTPSLQVGLDLSRVLTEASLQLFVEIGVSIVDVVDVSVLVMRSPSAETLLLFVSLVEFSHHSIHLRLRVDHSALLPCLYVQALICLLFPSCCQLFGPLTVGLIQRVFIKNIPSKALSFPLFLPPFSFDSRLL